MKKNLIFIISFCLTLLVILSQPACLRTETPLLYEKGSFPDSLIALTDINSAYDDYNITYYELSDIFPVVFSSSRGSSGGQYDLVQGAIAYSFDKTNGSFILMAGLSSDGYFEQLLTKSNTAGNDFGPYRLYSPLDGNEYMILSSVSENDDLDFFYTKNTPYFGTTIPEIFGPYPATIFNSGSDDAYICFDTDQDSAYFSRNVDGNFDICIHSKPLLTGW